MSARRMASSVVCEPLPTHLDQPPLIPKRIKAARASTTTGINFLRHPLLVDTLLSTAGVVLSEAGAMLSGWCVAEAGAMLSGLSEVVPLLLEIGSTVAAAGFVSGIFYLSSPRAFSN